MTDVSSATSGVDIMVPSGYTNLILICSVVCSGTDQLRIRFNDDSSNDRYSWTYKSFGTSSFTTVASGSGATAAFIDNGVCVSNSVYTINILNIAGSTVKFTSSGSGCESGTAQNLANGKWLGTSEITKINVYMPTYTLNGSKFILYGMK